MVIQNHPDIQHQAFFLEYLPQLWESELNMFYNCFKYYILLLLCIFIIVKMQTITVDILNNHVLNLLKDLELLKLIRLRKDKPEVKGETGWLAFKGTMTKQPLESVDQQLNELRNEWE